jgi:hypothetical protein
MTEFEETLVRTLGGLAFQVRTLEGYPGNQAEAIADIANAIEALAKVIKAHKPVEKAK